MTPADRTKIDLAERHVSVAVQIIRSEMPTIEASLAGKMTGNGSADRATLLVLAPLFEAARHFVRTHDAHLKLVRLAFEAEEEEGEFRR